MTQWFHTEGFTTPLPEYMADAVVRVYGTTEVGVEFAQMLASFMDITGWDVELDQARTTIDRVRAYIGPLRTLDMNAYQVVDGVAAALGSPAMPPPEDICKYPGCADKLMTGHLVTDSYFDAEDDLPYPMLHGSGTTGKIHIHAVWWQRIQRCEEVNGGD